MKYRFYIIIFYFVLQACSDDPGTLQVVDPTEQQPASVSLAVTVDNVPADNYSYAEVMAIIKDKPEGNNEVVFTADKGVFTNNENTYTVIVTKNDTIRVYLKYKKAEPVRVSASFFGFDTKEVYVNFQKAYPDQLLISPDSGSLPSEYTSKSLITAKLVRLNGHASEGMFVSYYDSIATVNGGSIGTFLNSTYSDAEGNAIVHYWLQDTTYHGFVYIKGYVSTPNGIVRGQNRILIE